MTLKQKHAQVSHNTTAENQNQRENSKSSKRSKGASTSLPVSKPFIFLLCLNSLPGAAAMWGALASGHPKAGVLGLLRQETERRSCEAGIC